MSGSGFEISSCLTLGHRRIDDHVDHESASANKNEKGNESASDYGSASGDLENGSANDDAL